MTGLAVAALVGAVVGGLVAGVWRLRRARRRERELEEARRRLAAAEEARERFFDLAAHELRAPLSAIFGYQELLQDGAYGELTPDAADAVERIGRAGHHLLHLADGIIELGRLRAGDLRPELETVDLGMILASAADTFRTQAAERGVTPTVELPDAMPRIRSDPDRLVRALDLAITSAIRHPAGAAMTLQASIEDGLARVRIGPTEIEVGPDPDDPASIGIRLAVVRRIAALLGGGLELPTEDGRVREIVLRIAVPPPGPPGL